MTRIPTLIDGEEQGYFETSRGYVAGVNLKQEYRDVSKDLASAKLKLSNFKIKHKGKPRKGELGQQITLLEAHVRRAEKGLADVTERVKNHTFD